MRDIYILSFYLLIPIISFEADEVSAIAWPIRDDIAISFCTREVCINKCV